MKRTLGMTMMAVAMIAAGAAGAQNPSERGGPHPVRSHPLKSGHIVRPHRATIVTQPAPAETDTGYPRCSAAVTDKCVQHEPPVPQ